MVVHSIAQVPENDKQKAENNAFVITSSVVMNSLMPNGSVKICLLILIPPTISHL